MKLTTLYSMFLVIKEIEAKFNTSAFIYYDDSDKDYSIAISNVDLYLSNLFREYVSNVAKKSNITVISLPRTLLEGCISFKDLSELFGETNPIHITEKVHSGSASSMRIDYLQTSETYPFNIDHVEIKNQGDRKINIKAKSNQTSLDYQTQLTSTFECKIESINNLQLMEIAA
ncbi:MAG TPA: hypothetical protein PK079_23440 [Leptospiraceae bacterium]|nr:hypothetical protein [Leptospiraceae bacterium]HMW07609.1 hypothetical protein [Leptospiraceae bacterium]HMX33013.1 hypothetical protein [Leptospiraceae bacterium]HMY33272.1 hypothetical protein [Leptospiraceae bacterium]HMZ67285.1 hypothetical protein [Leptospiraceae bacterium]